MAGCLHAIRTDQCPSEDAWTYETNDLAGLIPHSAVQADETFLPTLESSELLQDSGRAEEAVADDGALKSMTPRHTFHAVDKQNVAAVEYHVQHTSLCARRCNSSWKILGQAPGTIDADGMLSRDLQALREGHEALLRPARDFHHAPDPRCAAVCNTKVVPGAHMAEGHIPDFLQQFAACTCASDHEFHRT